MHIRKDDTVQIIAGDEAVGAHRGFGSRFRMNGNAYEMQSE